MALSPLLARQSSPYFNDWLIISACREQAQSLLLREPVKLPNELQQRQLYTQAASGLSGHVSQLCEI